MACRISGHPSLPSRHLTAESKKDGEMHERRRTTSNAKNSDIVKTRWILLLRYLKTRFRKQFCFILLSFRADLEKVTLTSDVFREANSTNPQGPPSPFPSPSPSPFSSVGVRSGPSLSH